LCIFEKNSRIEKYYFLKEELFVKKNKFVLLATMALTSLVFLSGCVGIDRKTGNPTGFIWNVLGRPMGEAIKFFANNLGLGFGLGIIIVTLIVRLIILPLGLYQSWKATYQSEKMNYLKPILGPIQDRMKTAKTQEEKLLAQQELMMAQRENGVSMFGGIGCLPLLIQMPFFSALFFAAQHTKGIAGQTFLGIPLGKPSLLLTAIVAVLYYIQSVLSLHGIEDETQKESMRKASLMSPIMIAVFSVLNTAGVTLYWVVGGVIQIIQQFVVNYLIRPNLRKRVAEEYKNNPPKATSHRVKKDVTPTATTQLSHKPKSNRNAGKQRNRK
jgi:YidC/Oxa1 family membrane protein insertase